MMRVQTRCHLDRRIGNLKQSVLVQRNDLVSVPNGGIYSVQVSEADAVYTVYQTETHHHGLGHPNGRI